MLITVFDCEGNGLYEEATRLWCGCTKDNQGGAFQFGPDRLGDLFNRLHSSDIIVGHNILGYDLPVMEKLYGYHHKGKVLDTLVLSRVLEPERVGRHSIEAWGERFGVPKPAHEDWSRYTPEMLHRCTEDTNINYKLLYHLLKEAELTEEDLCQLPTYSA